MRWSEYYLHTTREVPKDAEVVSHQLMARAGMIRKVAAGIYSYLPSGWRSLRKLMGIVRREMEQAGSVELSMPAVHPAELWKETGRWDLYGHLLLRMQDRQGRDFCFGPTHEEVITDIVRRDVASYRQLPLNLFQIQTKFRDEIRPRFGLMRGREFVMKDAYSFHVDQPSLDATYERMREAYCRVFETCGLRYARVEADSGTIGGANSHEFMVLADTGEDAIVQSTGSSYAANVERASAGTLPSVDVPPTEEREEVATPGKTTVAEVAEFLGLPVERFVKTLVYESNLGLVAALVQGDRSIQETKLKNALGVDHIKLASEAKVRQVTGAPVGFAGPVGLSDTVDIVADHTVEGMTNFVCGANKADAHWVHVEHGRDFEVSRFADLLAVEHGDPSPDGKGTLELSRGIEVGHIFDLGTKYSEAMGCTFTDDQGQERPMLMGCYGLGVGRTLAAAVEQNHDDQGMVWPLPLAPFEVLVAALQPDQPEVAEAAETIYRELWSKGVDVLLDDRNERPGVKFKDADLIGFPIRVVVGAKSLAEGHLELSLRRDGERHLVPKADVVEQVMAWRELLSPATNRYSNSPAT